VIPFAILLKSLVENVNIFGLGRLSLFLELSKGGSFGHMLGDFMLGVGRSERQKVVLVEDDTPLLHNTERALHAGLLHVPYHLAVDALT